MDKWLEQLSNDFTVKAQRLFISTYENFRLSTKDLDRQKDENVFQLQLGKYLNTLKSQLENIARELLAGNKAIKNIDHFNKLLNDNITMYLREFRQKAQLL